MVAWIFLVSFTAILAGGFARVEGRSVALWTAIGIPAAIGAAWWLGNYFYATPVVVLVPLYGVLFLLNLRDDIVRRRRAGGARPKARRGTLERPFDTR